MSASSEFSSAQAAVSDPYSASTAAARSFDSRARLTSLRSTSGNALSALVQGVLSAAASRSAQILAESVGKTADEIQNQLDAIIPVLPTLSVDHSVAIDDGRFNVPRRHIDVLRSEFLKGLSEQTWSPDG